MLNSAVMCYRELVFIVQKYIKLTLKFQLFIPYIYQNHPFVYLAHEIKIPELLIRFLVSSNILLLGRSLLLVGRDRQ